MLPRLILALLATLSLAAMPAVCAETSTGHLATVEPDGVVSRSH